MRILVCDDDIVRGRRTLRHIADTEVRHETSLLCGENLKDEIAKLFQFATEAIAGDYSSFPVQGHTPSFFFRISISSL